MKQEIKEALRLALTIFLATQALFEAWNHDYPHATFLLVLSLAINHHRTKDTK